MPRITTLTLNPAIDQTIVLDTLRPGHVNRATAATFHAGGKGINVASCLADWLSAPPITVTVTGLIGAANAAIFQSLCTQKRLEDRLIRLPGATRTNLKLLANGDTTDINLPGLPIDPGSLAKCRADIETLAGPDSLILLAGSLPPGVQTNVYATLIAALKPTGAKILLDTSGAPLTAALHADTLPHCIKPNRAELEDFCGRPLPTQSDLITAALSLRARGIDLVVISLGAEGALFVGTKILHAAPPPIQVASSVGAGDAMVAGLIAALASNENPESTARLATAFAAGKLGQSGPNLPSRETIIALAATVQITELEGEET